MKKLKYIAAAFLLSVTLSACTIDIPGEDTSLPTVDIVQRSELLDMVNIDHVLTDDLQHMLAEKDVAVKMKDFDLTADNMAQFVLVFTAPNGQFEYKFNTVIDYTANPDGSFDNIRLYWGDIKAVENGLFITSLHDYTFLPLNEKVENFTPHYITFVKDKGGVIVHSTAGFGKYAFMYRTVDEEGIAVFDKSGKMLAHTSTSLTESGGSELFGMQTAELVADIPFSYKNQFKGEFINDELFKIDLNGWYSPTCRLYNITDNKMSDTAHKYTENLIVGDTEYSVYELQEFVVFDDGDAATNFGGLALKKENGSYTDAFLYDIGDYFYEKQSSGNLYLNDKGELVCHYQPSGLRVIVDFENNACKKEYIVTEDMLGEKIALSKDKNFSLYEYNKHLHNNFYISYLALKNEKTGQLTFVDKYEKVEDNCSFALEAGFFSNGDIYLLTDFDFKVFTTDNVADGPVISIGEKFPLGVRKEDNSVYNRLHAARRDPTDGSFIVVFDHLSSSRWYTGPFDANDNSLYDDTFEVSLLDGAGNLVKTYTTDMPVPVGKYALDIFLAGDVLTMQNVDKETDKILQKATLNIKTGKFTQVQKWKSPQ